MTAIATEAFEALVSGYYLEALVIGDDAIWYSDVVEGGVKRLGFDGSGGHWLSERLLIGGLLLNMDGSLLVAGTDGIAWFNPATGASGMLLESIDGQPVGGVNEMTPDGAGGIVFGTIDLASIERGERPGPSALYRLDIDRQVTKLWDDLAFSNGLGFSADGKRLYHNESFLSSFAYDVAPDGSLGGRTLIAEKPDCDGMAIDSEGHVWISGFRSPELLVVNDDGSVHRRLAFPGDASTNVRFGGADGRDLYVTTVTLASVDGLVVGDWPKTKESVLYRTRSEVAGRPVPRTRFLLG